MACAMCRSELTVETRFELSEGEARAVLRKKGVSPSLLGSHRESFSVTRAAICLDCGHVALVMAAGSLEKLRAQLPALEPM